MYRMPGGDTNTDLILGTRFPQRLLNALPAGWKRKHLLRKSSNKRTAETFHFSTDLRDARKLVFAWPDRSEEILIAFPAARAVIDALPSGTECVHLCETADRDLVQGLFPHAVLDWSRGALPWHDPPMRTLVSNLRRFGPDTTISFSRAPIPLPLQAALRSSGAKVRIAWEGAMDAPYANTFLQPDPATPLAARFFQCHTLWRYAGINPQERWLRITPDTGRHLEALEEWESKRATPATTWLFVQDAATGRPLTRDLFQTLRERIRARHPEKFTLGAVVWNPGGGDVPREGPWHDAPVFGEPDFSSMLAALEGARGVIAFNGFGLHFASLAEVRCLALLTHDEAIYDSSKLNPLFEVEWMAEK